jgi:ornithine cyclodeaminase/alanine dehydrogenase-like protein (mu-crystallin family)
MIVVGPEQVHYLLPFDELIEGLREAHLGDTPRHDRYIMHEPRPEGPPDIFINLPAWQPGEGIGVKLVTSFPGNKEKYGIPTVNAIHVWIDGKRGTPEAVMDGEALIFRKTAADSALGATMLARPDVETMLMIGAGALAPYLVQAHVTARPSIKRVLVWNRTSVNAQTLADKVANELGVEAEPIDDLREGIRRAELISSATMSTDPLVFGAEVQPGTHVDLVGSFTPEMRESDDDLLKLADIYVDSYGTTERSGDFLGPFDRGVITPDDIIGDMYGLCRREIPWRQSDSQITLMKNGGGSHLDYYTARFLMRKLAASDGI